eukprot:20037-Heterococcus_DN1.PRE.3
MNSTDYIEQCCEEYQRHCATAAADISSNIFAVAVSFSSSTYSRVYYSVGAVRKKYTVQPVQHVV